MKFQDKFYDIIDHNKCPSSEKPPEKCILRKSYFHHSEPNYNIPCLTPHLCRLRQPRECRGPGTCRRRCRPPAPGHAVRTAWPRAAPARAWPRVRACTVCARSSHVSRVTRAAAMGTSAARAGTVTDSISDQAVSLSSRRMFISRVLPN